MSIKFCAKQRKRLKTKKITFTVQFHDNSMTSREYTMYLEVHAVTIGYIANESMVDSGELYYMINKGGHSTGYDEIKAFKISDEVIERK